MRLGVMDVAVGAVQVVAEAPGGRGAFPSGVEHLRVDAPAAGQRLAIPDEEPSPFGATAPAPAAPTTTFPAWPAAKYKLTAVDEALRRSRNFQSIAHIGWTQPGYPRDAAKFIPINSLVPGSSGWEARRLR